MISVKVVNQTNRSITYRLTDHEDDRVKELTIFKDALSEKDYRERIVIRVANAAIAFTGEKP